MRKIAAAFIAVLGWLALILQFVLHITNPLAPDVSFAELLVRFFSYFTILTNVIAAITLTAIAFFPSRPIGRFVSRPSVQAAVAVYITIVGVVYSLFLRDVWDPAGWNAVADHSLHDVMPILYVGYWLVFASKAGISWIDPVKWLTYPAGYFAYSLLRGAVVGWYPYWFADVGLLGYPTALTNAGMVLLAFLVTGFVYTGVARSFSRKRPAG